MHATDSTRSASTSAPSAKQPKMIGRRVMRPREQVEELVRSAILTSDLRPGERLPSETELARQFDVSRTTVREALRSLTSEGLIRKIPGAGGGSFVQSVDYESLGVLLQGSVHNLLRMGGLDFEEVALVRQYLEVPAGRLAAVHRSAEDINELEAVLAAQKRASVDDPAVPDLDAQFHAAIAKASGNRALASLVHALHRETEPVHYLDLSPEVGRQTVKQHVAILKAIKTQDESAAEIAIVKHLTYLRGHILQVPSQAIIRR
ncbi:GntR family transcriptional regulator [Rhodococcoides fascians]|nr:GntR family transcriptional regulator [Rhodococcus sp. 06-1059B-a]OZE81429.1 GntR family transcriptional regulator [Rhodococcus fascians]OZF10253.1 GntR family transcriptional regulator [Rhodococcus fascians]OZF13343.1 GntR family transcriptional regulator [Rhodococcus fascians]OZF59441.1 GntR family transcriptional regulator [Rhodococcus fascians]